MPGWMGLGYFMFQLEIIAVSHTQLDLSCGQKAQPHYPIKNKQSIQKI